MKLSIVTPTYNQGKFVGRTFQSILDQEIDFGLEYIVVDAISTDCTQDVVKAYEARFREAGIEFRYICEKDNGQSDAINKGWKISTGDLVSYINSDDYYERSVLSCVVRFFKDNPNIKWAYGGWKLVDINGKVYKKIQPKRYKKSKLLNYCNIGQPSCFFRRSLLNETGMLNQKLHLAMDYDLWLRFASKYDAGIIGGILSNMRYHSETKSSTRTENHLKEGFNLAKAYTGDFSWRRFCQYFYYLRGLAVIKLNMDISRRIETTRILAMWRYRILTRA